MASVLVPCPHCDCHAKSSEETCPSCGEALRRADGSVPRTTVAVLLGLTAAAALGGACSSTSGPQPFYGPAMTTSTSAGTGGAGTGGGTGGTVTAVFYGPAMTTSSGGGNGTGGKDGG